MARLRARVHTVIISLGTVAFFVGAWSLIAEMSQGRALPNLVEVGAAIVRMTLQGTYLHDIFITLVRFLIGWLIGSALAIPLGLLTGRERWLLGPILERCFNAQRAVPVIALVPLVGIWWGFISEPAKIFVVAWGVFFPVWVNTHNGVRAVNPNYLNAARSLGTRGMALWSRVLIPHVSESILTGVRVSIGVGMICVVAGELMGTYQTGFFRGGLGYRTWVSTDLFQLPELVACIFTFGVLGWLADHAFVRLARRLVLRILRFDPMRSTLRVGTAAAS